MQALVWCMPNGWYSSTPCLKLARPAKLPLAFTAANFVVAIYDSVCCTYMSVFLQYSHLFCKSACPHVSSDKKAAHLAPPKLHLPVGRMNCGRASEL
jgi:hypothetical protein